MRSWSANWLACRTGQRPVHPRAVSKRSSTAADVHPAMLNVHSQSQLATRCQARHLLHQGRASFSASVPYHGHLSHAPGGGASPAVGRACPPHRACGCWAPTQPAHLRLLEELPQLLPPLLPVRQQALDVLNVLKELK